MNKHLSMSLILSLLLNQNPITAFSFSSLNTKHFKNTVAITSGLLSIPCFKKCYDLHVEHNSLLKAVLPNFNELMKRFEEECDKHINYAYPSGTYARLWNKFLKTNVEPTHPELVPQLNTLNTKSAVFAITGILLTTVALLCILDNYAPKNNSAPNIN